MVGSAINRKLEAKGYTNLITRTHSELDLTNQQAVNEFFEAERPEYVFLAAAKVGGILANSTYPAEFIYENLMIEANVIHATYAHNVKKLLFLGSSCIYPKLAPQPLKEVYLRSKGYEVHGLIRKASLKTTIQKGHRQMRLKICSIKKARR